MSNLTQDVTVYFISLLSGAPPLSASGNVFHYEVIVKDKNVPVCVDCWDVSQLSGRQESII